MWCLRCLQINNTAASLNRQHLPPPNLELEKNMFYTIWQEVYSRMDSWAWNFDFHFYRELVQAWLPKLAPFFKSCIQDQHLHRLRPFWDPNEWYDGAMGMQYRAWNLTQASLSPDREVIYWTCVFGKRLEAFCIGWTWSHNGHSFNRTIIVYINNNQEALLSIEK